MNRLTKMIILSILVCTQLSCDDDDSATVPSELDGRWSLINVSGGTLDIDINFEPDEISWNFNLDRGEVLIENAINAEDPRQLFAGLPDGSYSFELRRIQNSLILYIDGQRMGFLFVSNNVLSVNSGVSRDGYITGFERFP
ncbi:hypothetical protein ACJD0Z_04350 [Flavobacteriaceae bacterium M23B6Z8]